ncbi:hypothetical protein Tsubulata_014057 [Turnera subulata]|uniref:AB hydrolase-1 domain-containing protein n=1 Tax=Turnera subulata TaxID=218843 RepID=A0A9Q0JR36_9ROSI|nr:hypothetical protein Tsubulata_014057 [Turnera subulata]
MVGRFQQLVLLAQQQQHYNYGRCGSIVRTKTKRCVVGFPVWQDGYGGGFCPKVVKLPPLHASVSGAGGAQYSEQLVDARTRKRKKRIADVDQDELLDPTQLADPDSCFCEFNGVHIHHKVYNAETEADNAPESQSGSQLSRHDSRKLGLPMILLHGFGASVFSWNRVMKPLAELIGSKVLAFDRPAFGLTSRVDSFLHLSLGNEDAKPLNPYSMAFSVLATLYFIDFLAAEKVVLVGHSAGSLVAVNAYFEAPERVAALILVAPAIFAPLGVRKIKEGTKTGTNTTTEGDESDSTRLWKPFMQLLEGLTKLAKTIAQMIVQMVMGMANMLNSWYKKALAAFLRSALGVMLIRMLIDKFGVAAVRTAWYDSKQLSDDVLNGYTKPLRAKGWDKALAEFTAATLANMESESKPPLSNRLHEISCPVLIITGDNDRIVPTWNAKRLAQAIPGACLEIIKNCGHLPHEEKVEEFVSIVDKFLQRVCGDQKELSAQAAA